MPPWLFLTAYMLSGLAGLVYEVTWTRLLTLVMGHGLAATSTVLAAFMGGLALGAVVAGRAAGRLSPTRALHVYAALEILVVLCALGLPVGLSGLTPLFASVYRDGDGGAVFAVTRLVGCLLLLLPPAMALGGTFPVAVRWVTLVTRETASAAGWLYAVNTIGAGVGAGLAGFVLLPALGVTATTLVGAGASLLAVACVLRLASRGGVPGVTDAVVPIGPPPRRKPMLPPRTPVRAEDRARPAAAIVIVMLTGLATFSAEIGWTRVFALVIGPSAYAFAATVATFIGGLAIGATGASAVATRTRQPGFALALTLGSAALAAAIAIAAAGTWLPRRVLADFIDAPSGGLLIGHALLAMMMIVPTAVGLGAAFPLALALAGGGSAPARRAAGIYAVNTLAAVAGSLLTGFAAIPLLGLERTLAAGVLLLVAAAAVAAGGRPVRTGRLAISLAPSAAALFWLASGSAWDRELLASGAYKYAADVVAGLDVEAALRAGELVSYEDGATGTVSVKRLTGHLSLAIDGKVDASTGGDMLTQKLLAHAPLLLHPEPKRVAIVGLGSGVTLASALTHPVERVDVLEISPEVARASRHFAPATGSPLDNPRTRLIVADGRTHLALAEREYDVIISEPSNPWMAGVAALFTREFFQAARRRLAPGGLLCQWVNTYDISTDDLRSVVATVVAVFPHATLWLVGEGDLLIIASASPIERRFAGVPTAWGRPGVADDLRPVGVAEPFQLWSLYLGGDAAAAQFGRSAAVQRDDRLALEFSAPKALRTGVRRDNVARLREVAASTPRPAAVEAAWRSVTAGQLAQRAVMLTRAGAFADAYEAALTAVSEGPRRPETLATFVAAAAASGRQADANAALAALASRYPGETALLVALSRLAGDRGALDAAARSATRAVQLAPGDPDALEQLASVFADAGDVERLASAVAALATHGERAGSHYYAAVWRFMRGQLDAAEHAARQALARDPGHARAHNLLGTIYATRGDVGRARETFTAALAADPRDPTIYQNLGLLEMDAGRAGVAARRFAEALTLDPSSEPAREALGRAQAAAGHRRF